MESLRPDDLKMRKHIDYSSTYDGKTILILEHRPFWNDTEKIQNKEFAKIKFYKSKQLWNLYWMRASGKWDIYEPFAESTHLQKILDSIIEDSYGCFFG